MSSACHDLSSEESISQLYRCNIPSPESLNSELQLEKQKWIEDLQASLLVITPERAINSVDKDFFPQPSYFIFVDGCFARDKFLSVNILLAF